jgi:TrpR family transcriptional regulator, trp operon repressor
VTNHFQDNAYDSLLSACAKLKTQEQVRQFFELFLTPEERKDLTHRFLIIQELISEEKTQREIAKNLGVSIAQITRGSNMWKVMHEEAKKLIRKVIF